MYVFSNLDDKALEDLSHAVYEERNRRWIENNMTSLPKLEVEHLERIERIKTYRVRYNITLGQAMKLERHHHGIKKAEN